MRWFFFVAGILLLGIALAGGKDSKSQHAFAYAVGAVGLIIASSLCFIGCALLEAADKAPRLNVEIACFLLGFLCLTLAVGYFFQPGQGVKTLVFALPGGSALLGAAIIESAIRKKAT